ncbi:MAG: undecaprenyl diphosphate synthase family protein, partial [bacterium]
AAGTRDPESIDETTLASRRYTAGIPAPDLLVRTAGEMRISNYLLWQISYAELHVTEVLWPDFTEADFHGAIRAFGSRDRRFGGLGAKTGDS